MHLRNRIKPVVVREKSYWPHLAAIAVLWAGAMTMEYSDAKASANEAERQFTSCLKGEWMATTEEGHTVKCWPVELLRKEEKR